LSRIVYVNGRYVPYAQAAVHVEDRGFQFADAIYEVCEVRSGHLVDEARHMARLSRSLAELQIAQPMKAAALGHVMRQVIRRNHVRLDTVALSGIAVKSRPDIRWQRCDIKTVMLLPACLAKEAARRDGAREAWFIDNDGFVTEGASSNAWIVDRSGAVITRQLGVDILPGVTRATLVDELKGEKISLIERPFRLTEAYDAQEAFITSATQTVMPVVRIDGRAVGAGKPGPIAQRLRLKFHQFAAISSG
jgi:D-alanine transaminase